MGQEWGVEKLIPSFLRVGGPPESAASGQEQPNCFIPYCMIIMSFLWVPGHEKGWEAMPYPGAIKIHYKE